jgi:hypothetical protein
MAALSATDLASIRDEIGTATPPTDAQLAKSHLELGDWRLVAIRTLKRRFAGLASGGVQSVAIPGAVSVSLRSDLKALQSQIDRLQSDYEAATGVDLPGGASSTRLHRTTAR